MTAPLFLSPRYFLLESIVRVIATFGFDGVNPDSPEADEIIESLVMDTKQWQLGNAVSYECVDDAFAADGEGKMKIIVTCPDTIFGDIVTSFDNYIEAMKWVEVCVSNGLKAAVEKS